ncbi:MAG: glycine cleavage T C-terminal barrel domain-containing protein [Gemmatimonadota bacterium]
MTAALGSPLIRVLESAGAVTGDYHGVRVARHFGDPRAEYVAATEGAAVLDRSHRTRLLVEGRAPRRMLNGIVTGTVPDRPDTPANGGSRGRASYSCVLTSKGRMITDLWCLCRGEGESESFLLDVPVAGAAGLMDNLHKVLPPRFAAVEDVSSRTAMISVVGPEAPRLTSRLAVGLRVDASDLTSLEEGEWRASGTSADEGLTVVRTGDVWPEAYNILGPVGPVTALWTALVEAGARPAGLGVWSTLRVEAGRPAFGVDMDEATIPVEAGIHERAIDHGKGCYTGQEVIVRIRDRGHVNRHLRQLHLGDVPTPPRGTELFVPGEDKPVGVVTSAVESPRFGEVVALGYVRRGVVGEPAPR